MLIDNYLVVATILSRSVIFHGYPHILRKWYFEHLEENRNEQMDRSFAFEAEKITGAHWSGPRFFGLTQRARALVGAEASR
jgi:hypothetical protein